MRNISNLLIGALHPKNPMAMDAVAIPSNNFRIFVQAATAKRDWSAELAFVILSGYAAALFIEVISSRF